MSTIKCVDSDGRLVRRLFQWDKNISVTISGVGDVNEPVFHLSNQESETAVVVTPTVSGDSLTVKIPNMFLQAGLSIIAYLYTKTQDGGYRTVHVFYIPVAPRQKPDDYEFEDNVDYINAAEMKEEMDEILALLEKCDVGGLADELEDIRVGYDGTVYQSAGDAVRAIGVEIRVLTERIGNLYEVATDAEAEEMIDDVFGI